MSASATGSSLQESLADLSHRLRTPLTHIMGYSSLLIEDSRGGAAISVDLDFITGKAEAILRQIATYLSPLVLKPAEEKIADLREAMREPLGAIVERVGSLICRSSGADRLDVLRIAHACAELIAFEEKDESSQRTYFAAPAVLSPSFSQYSTAPASGSARILVIDDVAGNLDMLSRQLTHSGFLAVCAESGQEGLRVLERERFDLVLLDVMMPRVSGIDVLQQIKAIHLLADIPVIMISALDEVESAAACIELGAEDYLVKPFDPVLLRARLHSAIERRRLHAEQYQRTQDLEKATQDLRRANEDLQSFAFAASHDLQEPLRTVTTTLQLLSLQYGSAFTPDQEELVRLAVDSSSRMSHLISDLLAYSLAGTEEVDLKIVDSEAALAEALTNLRESIRADQATVTSSGLPPVLATHGQLVRLFQNLVGNAIKYRGAKPPSVTVYAERDGDNWIISVCDNGIGIPEQHLRTIFQPFGRLHGRERPGTGLGLAICERIVRRSGGRIWARSEPGLGSVFYFTARSVSPSTTREGENGTEA